ncbi:MAG: hypothetical protein ABI361_07965 [Nitrososphaera sp.]
MPTRAGGHRDPRRIAQDSDPPGEKWLVAFRNPSSRSRPDSSLVREFLAPGFYEAYDIVMTFAERTNFEVLWFKERRLCEGLEGCKFPMLDARCTFCNKRFNHAEPVPCFYEDCGAQFCSRDCMAEHKALRHR